VNAAAGWTPRYEHVVVADRKDSLYVIGGMSSGDQEFNDVWRSEQTCADDVHCSGDNNVCRDGTDKNFEGSSSPVCVDLCDRRIFSDCKHKEACRVKDHEAVCVDPCQEQDCGKGEVCETAERDGHLPGKTDLLKEATPFCLACLDSKTKFACDKLQQCEWHAGQEACLTKCEVLKTKGTCTSEHDTNGDVRCEWDGGKCKSK